MGPDGGRASDDVSGTRTLEGNALEESMLPSGGMSWNTTDEELRLSTLRGNLEIIKEIP